MGIRDKFYGIEFWKTMDLFFVLIIEGSLLPIFMVFTRYAFNIFIGMGFLIMLYVIIRQRYLKKMDEPRRGKKVNAGWIDHRVGVGEEYHLVIADVQPIEQLPKKELAAVDYFEKIYTERSKQQKSVKTGFDEFIIPEQEQKSLENKEEQKQLENKEKETESKEEKIDENL